MIDLYSPYCIHLTVGVQRFKDDSKSQLLQYSEKHYDIAYHATMNKTAHLETPSTMTVHVLSMSQLLCFNNTVETGVKVFLNIRVDTICCMRVMNVKCMI